MFKLTAIESEHDKNFDRLCDVYPSPPDGSIGCDVVEDGSIGYNGTCVVFQGPLNWRDCFANFVDDLRCEAIWRHVFACVLVLAFMFFYGFPLPFIGLVAGVVVAVFVDLNSKFWCWAGGGLVLAGLLGRAILTALY